MPRQLTMLLLVLLFTAALAGCIPSEPPSEPAATPAEEAAKAGVVLVGEGETGASGADSDAAGGPENDLALEDMPHVNAAIQVISRSEQSGYVVRGTLNPKEEEAPLTGTILPEKAPAGANKTTWKFSATYTAPTGGYALGKPFLSRTFGRNVIISLPIALPDKNAAVSQAREQHAASLTFEAPPDASFVVQWFQGRDIGNPVATPEEVGRRGPTPDAVGRRGSE